MAENTNTTNEPVEETPEPEAGEPDAPEAEPFDEAKARAKIDKANREAQQLRKRLRDLEEQSAKKVDESEVQKAAREAAEKAAEEFGRQLARKEKEAAVFKAAGGKLNDPDDALRYIDLDEVEDVATAVAELLESRPYLAVPTDIPAGRDAASKASSKPKPYAEMTVPEYAAARGIKLPGRR